MFKLFRAISYVLLLHAIFMKTIQMEANVDG